MIIIICPDALVALRTGRQGILLAQKPEIGDDICLLEASRLRPPSPTTVTDRGQRETGLFDFFSMHIKGYAS